MENAKSSGRKSSRRKKQSNPVGRPRKIDSPETFDALVDSYLAMCRNAEKPEPITLTGMILALGLCSRDGLDGYAEYPEFADSVKRAKMFIEHEYEKRLIVSTNAAAPIFALKNFGWKDRQPADLDLLQAEKLRRELAQGEEDPQSMPESVSVTVRDARKRDS